MEPCFENDETPENFDDYRKVFTFKLRSYILIKDSYCEVDILFGVTSMLNPYIDGSVMFDISTSTLSLDENLSNSKQQVVMHLMYTAPLTFSGVSWPNVIPVQTNSSFFPVDKSQLQNSSQLIEQAYLINNLGNLELKSLVLNVKWPANLLLDNKVYDAFYIKNITCNGRSAKCSCQSENLIDRYKIYSNITSKPPSNIPTTQVTQQSLSNCEGKCTTSFQCNIEYIKAYGRVKVTIVTLPYPNTFSTLKSSVLVTSTGTLQIKERGFLNFDFRGGSNITNIETKVISSKQFEFDGQETGFVFPIWAYILSAVIGLLLLLLLIFILRMCGFFKSKYADKRRAAEEEREWGEAAIPLQQ